MIPLCKRKVFQSMNVHFNVYSTVFALKILNYTDKIEITINHRPNHYEVNSCYPI